MRFLFLRRGVAWLSPLIVASITALLVVAVPQRSLRQRFRRLVYRLVPSRVLSNSVAPADARQAIAAVTAAYVDALLRGNASAYAAAFDDEALAVPGTGPIRRGRSAIEEAIGATFARVRFLEAEMSTVDLRLTGETAIETGRYRFVVHPYLDPRGVPRTASGRYAFVWKRVAGVWRLSLDVGQPALIEA
jgi:uncharacterized protein (TIGR02246 family)